MTNPPTPLLIATGNSHKAGEIEAILRRLLPGASFSIRLASEFPAVREPAETAMTFFENALIKAHHYARSVGMLALADDSGLVIDALDGGPGVRSARYAETSQGRIDRVLRELEGIEAARRTARFVCVAALADPGGAAVTREGSVEGWITHRQRGAGGFGYDPIFVPARGGISADRIDSDAPTLAEYSAADKNLMSHRATAVEQIAEVLGHSLRHGRVVEPTHSQSAR